MNPNRLLSALLAVGLGLALLSPTSSGQATLYGNGCSGIGPAPTIGHSGTPAPFQQQTIHMSGMAPGTLVALFMGTSAVEIDISGLSGVSPGCLLLSSGELQFFLTADGSGEIDFTFPYKLLYGPDLYFQFGFYESVGPDSILVSQGLHLHVPLETTPSVGTLDFGPVHSGALGSLQFTVDNTTAFSRTITDLVLYDVDASDFSASIDGGLPAVIPAGGSTTVGVDFSPGMPGPRQARLKLVHSGLPAGWSDPEVELQGIGLGLPGADLLIDAGASGISFDSQGQMWIEEFGIVSGATGSSADAVTGTTDAYLYQTHRSGSLLRYTLPLPVADYALTFHFVEPVFTQVGQRLQDVRIEGNLRIEDLDVFDQVGHDAAYTVSVPVTLTDGTLDVIISGVQDDALLAALEVRTLFPVASLSPATHDFGALDLGQNAQLALTLENTGTGDLEVDGVTFLMNQGAGSDFVLDLDGVQYTGDPDMGPGHSVTLPASFTLGAGQQIGATLDFTPLSHVDYDLTLTLEGNGSSPAVDVSGSGGSGGHPFLHVVIEPVGQPVDYDGDGFEDVTLDGSLSHTHEPGGSLVGFSWEEGQTVLATTDVLTQSFAVGSHGVCLTITDDNLPAEELTDCVTFSVSPVTDVPGVLAQYFDTGATPPETLLDGGLGLPDWTETLETFELSSGASVGGSPFTGQVVARLSGELSIDVADTYEFALVGGTDARLEIGGLAYTAPLALGVGDHAIEARFALTDTADLPVQVLMGTAGGGLEVVSGTDVVHDETLDPPIINTMTDTGSTLGGNTIVLSGFGFFPDASVTVHWGAQALTQNDFVSLDADKIVLLSPAHAAGIISVQVQTPLGFSNAVDFEYDAAGPPPIQFTLDEVATVQRPITGAWGPDGRFYVAMRFGQITALTFDDDYDVVGQTVYPGVSGLSNNEMLGLTFNPFDPDTPVTLYVAHSDLYAQDGDPPVSPYPYPGQVSKLVGPDFDTPVPLITGLPTSNHDHAVNGIVFDNNGDLLIGVGSNTNAGVAHIASGGLPETPLSAAILKARLSDPGFSGTITHLETVGGAPNEDQLFGEVVDIAPGVDIELHAVGVRNPFDLVYTTTGRLYAFDNGPNSGFGPASTGPASEFPGHAAAPDELLLIEKGRYYGSPNRSRGRGDPRQDVYHSSTAPSVPWVHAAPLMEVSSSMDGIDEYRSAAFKGQLLGQLIGQRWNDFLHRFELSADGRSVVSSTTMSPETSALGARTGPGGAIVTLDFSLNKVKVLEPDDISVTGVEAWDIFPWRAPASGGTPFVIGGRNFGSPGDTLVTVDGIPATVTAVSSSRIEGLLPPAAILDTALHDVVIDTAGQRVVLPQALRWLFVPAGSEPGRWDDPADMPTALGEVAAGEIDGVIYVVGDGSTDTLAYDIYAGTWSTRAARPFPGHHHAAEVFDGKLYLFGGILNGSPGKVQIYDPVADSWSSGAPMAWAASSSATAVIGDKIYVAGGMVNGSTTVANTVAYDPLLDSYTTLAPMPLPRNHAAAGTDGEKLWVFGGRGPGSGDANVVANGFDHVQVYDPVAGTWEVNSDPGSLVQPLPIGRGGMGKAVFKDGEFYVLGGETLNGPGATVGNVYDRVDVYDPVDHSWRLEAAMPVPRHGHFPVLFEGRIFVPGGGEQSGFAVSAAFDAFDRQ